MKPSAFKSLWSKQDGDVPFLQNGLATPTKLWMKNVHRVCFYLTYEGAVNLIIIYCIVILLYNNIIFCKWNYLVHGKWKKFHSIHLNKFTINTKILHLLRNPYFLTETPTTQKLRALRVSQSLLRHYGGIHVHPRHVLNTPKLYLKQLRVELLHSLWGGLLCRVFQISLLWLSILVRTPRCCLCWLKTARQLASYRVFLCAS